MLLVHSPLIHTYFWLLIGQLNVLMTNQKNSAVIKTQNSGGLSCGFSNDDTMTLSFDVEPAPLTPNCHLSSSFIHVTARQASQEYCCVVEKTDHHFPLCYYFWNLTCLTTHIPKPKLQCESVAHTDASWVKAANAVNCCLSLQHYHTFHLIIKH